MQQDVACICNSRVSTLFSSVQAGVVGLLKGSQVTRFALPAPEASTAASSAPAVPVQTSLSAASSSSPVQHAQPATSQLPPAGTPLASQPPPARTPKHPTPTPQSQHEASSSAATPPALASTSGQQSRYPHKADDVSSVSAQTDSATSRTQAGASTSGVKGTASSEPASTERQPPASQRTDQAKSDSVKPDSVQPAPSMVQPRQQQQPPASTAAAAAAADGASADAGNAGSSAALGNSGEAAIAPQQTQSQGSAHIEDQSGPVEIVTTGAGGSEPQLEAAGAEPGSALRAFDRDPAHSAQEAEQPPAESSESEAGSALQDQQAQSDQEAHPDAHAKSQTRTAASELTTNADTDAEADSSLRNKAEGKQEVASVSNAVRDPAGTSEGSMLSGKKQQMPSVTPPVLACQEIISNRSMQEGLLIPEEPLTGAASTSAASSKQTQGQVTGTEGPSASSTAVESTSGKRAGAGPASGGVNLPKPPASLKGEEKRGVAPAEPASRVSTVRSDTPSEASRPYAASSSATARDVNQHLNESQEKETEAQVLSPKGSSKSRQTVEMKRQQTSFNPLG